MQGYKCYPQMEHTKGGHFWLNDHWLGQGKSKEPRMRKERDRERGCVWSGPCWLPGCSATLRTAQGKWEEGAKVANEKGRWQDIRESAMNYLWGHWWTGWIRDTEKGGRHKDQWRGGVDSRNQGFFHALHTHTHSHRQTDAHTHHKLLCEPGRRGTGWWDALIVTNPQHKGASFREQKGYAVWSICIRLACPLAGENVEIII